MEVSSDEEDFLFGGFTTNLPPSAQPPTGPPTQHPAMGLPMSAQAGLMPQGNMGGMGMMGGYGGGPVYGGAGYNPYGGGGYGGGGFDAFGVFAQPQMVQQGGSQGYPPPQTIPPTAAASSSSFGMGGLSLLDDAAGNSDPFSANTGQTSSSSPATPTVVIPPTDYGFDPFFDPFAIFIPPETSQPTEPASGPSSGGVSGSGDGSDVAVPAPPSPQEKPLDDLDEEEKKNVVGVSPFLDGRFSAHGPYNVSSSNITAVTAGGANSLANDQIKLLSLLLTDPDFQIIHRLSDVIPAEDAPLVGRMLLVLMHANKFLIPPMVSIVQREVMEATSPTIMFRSDKLTTHMTSSFTSILGSAYLQNLSPMVTEIINKWEDLEVDPSRVANLAQIEPNQNKVLSYGCVMMEKLLCSLFDCPDEFFFVAQIMQIEILSKFPDKPEFRHRVIADFLFSRYVCTALVRPEDFNLYKPTNIMPGMTTSTSALPIIRARARRTLAFLSKLLHHTVIGRKCKEPYLRFMDLYIEEYNPKVIEFCSRLASPSHAYHPPPLANKIFINSSALRHVRAVLEANMDALEESLSKTEKGKQMAKELREAVEGIKSKDIRSAQIEGMNAITMDKKMKSAKQIGDRKTAIAGAGVGMVVGGAVGTVLVPGLGTIVGAAVGGAIAGGGVHQYGHNLKVKREKEIFKEEMAGVWDSFKTTDACYLCSVTFSVTNRKHHCRSCGHVFCNTCSRKRTYLRGIMWPVRVCDQCYVLFPMPANKVRPTP